MQPVKGKAPAKAAPAAPTNVLPVIARGSDGTWRGLGNYSLKCVVLPVPVKGVHTVACTRGVPLWVAPAVWSALSPFCTLCLCLCLWLWRTALRCRAMEVARSSWCYFMCVLGGCHCSGSLRPHSHRLPPVPSHCLLVPSRCSLFVSRTSVLPLPVRLLCLALQVPGRNGECVRGRGSDRPDPCPVPVQGRGSGSSGGWAAGRACR